jgi:hypothetical protein
MPCRKRALEKEIGLTEFGRAYDRLFKRPRLRRETHLDCWLSAELGLAGPMYETRTRGTIEWLFRGEERIPGVRDVDSLMRWFGVVIARMRSAADERRSTKRDDPDRRAILAKAADLELLVQSWHDFYVARHARGRADGGSKASR